MRPTGNHNAEVRRVDEGVAPVKQAGVVHVTVANLPPKYRQQEHAWYAVFIENKPALLFNQNYSGGGSGTGSLERFVDIERAEISYPKTFDREWLEGEYLWTHVDSRVDGHLETWVRIMRLSPWFGINFVWTHGIHSESFFSLDDEVRIPMLRQSFPEIEDARILEANALLKSIETESYRAERIDQTDEHRSIAGDRWARARELVGYPYAKE